MHPAGLDNMEQNSFVEGYFKLGLKYSEIDGFLGIVHGMFISLRKLKRFLRFGGLKR